VLAADQEGALRAGHGPRVVIQDVKETLLVIKENFLGGVYDVTIKTLRVFHGTGTASYSSDDDDRRYFGIRPTIQPTIPDGLNDERVGALHYVNPSRLGQATKFECTNGPQGVVVVFYTNANMIVGYFKGAQIGSDSWEASGSFQFV